MSLEEFVNAHLYSINFIDVPSTLGIIMGWGYMSAKSISIYAESFM